MPTSPPHAGKPAAPPHAPSGSAPPASGRSPDPHRWIAVVAACAGQFLVVLDVSVVNVALPAIRTDLAMSTSGLQWVVNAYTLAFAGFMLLGGRAADLFGRRRTFLAGLGLFTAASLAGGLATEPWQLVAARAVQGVGAAVLSPATLTILTTSFPRGPERTKAIATWTAVGAGGGAAGSLVGGVLTESLDWRWVLLINVPVGGLVLVAAALRLVEARERGARRRMDVPGALLVTAGLGTLAYGIVQTESAGWASAASLVPLAAGLVLLAAFVGVEARTREPLMPLRLLRVRSVWAANLAMFVNGSAMFCMWFFVSLYTQNVLGYTAVESGLAFVPQALAIVAGSKLAPLVMARIGGRNLALLGAGIAAVGCLWQSGMHAGGAYATTVLGPGLLISLGAGLAATPLATIATSGASAGDAGLVSGIVNTSRTMGGALGLAVLATVAAARTGGSESPAALADGYGLAFATGTGILAASMALMLLCLPRRENPENPENPETHEEEHARA